MPKVCYIERKFSPGSLDIIRAAEAICDEYKEQGFSLTLRQLYYQFVARGLIPNKDTEYKRLGSVINDARLAGLIDWSHIEDRTRYLRSNSHWDAPGDIIASAALSFAVDKWATQEFRCEVYIEKDALVGVIEDVCQAEDVPFFSCRGYTSQSEIWAAAQRLMCHCRRGQDVLIIHLGDHDPSGIDMSRDIAERLGLFVRGHIIEGLPDRGVQSWHINRVSGGSRRIEVRRIALNMPQVEEYEPPPNPAKLTDSRCTGYIKRFGDESWELDALPPNVIADLIRKHITERRDDGPWTAAIQEEAEAKELLSDASQHWNDVATWLKSKDEQKQTKPRHRK